MYVNYTPDEIGEMHDRNENFYGERANFEKIQLYQAVKRSLEAFLERCEDADLVDGYAPNIREKHAILWLDLVPAATLTKEETAALADIMNMADGTVLSSIGDRVRITFEINDVWDD